MAQFRTGRQLLPLSRGEAPLAPRLFGTGTLEQLQLGVPGLDESSASARTHRGPGFSLVPEGFFIEEDVVGGSEGAVRASRRELHEGARDGVKAERRTPTVAEFAVLVESRVCRVEENEPLGVLAGKSSDDLPVLSGDRVLPEDPKIMSNNLTKRIEVSLALLFSAVEGGPHRDHIQLVDCAIRLPREGVIAEV